MQIYERIFRKVAKNFLKKRKVGQGKGNIAKKWQVAGKYLLEKVAQSLINKGNPHRNTNGRE